MEIYRDLADNGERPSTGTIMAVAEAAGVEPTELEPLFHSVDSDTIDKLWEGSGLETTIEFDYEGFRVTLTGDDFVSVRSVQDQSTR